MKKEIKNSKGYKPEQQLPACCVPTCLRMIFNRHGDVPELTQEDIGLQLGLTIPLSLQDHFETVTGQEDPPPSGWGTRINQTRYSLETAFETWGLHDLAVSYRFIDSIDTEDSLMNLVLKLVENENEDTLVCVQSGALEGIPSPSNGHVVLLSGASEENAFLLDPHNATIHEPSYKTLHDAMALRGRENWGGLWTVSRSP